MKKQRIIKLCLCATLLMIAILPFNLTALAKDYNDFEYFNLWGDASAEIRYIENGLSDEFVASMPFSRLNSSQVYGSSFVVYYGDYSTFVEYSSPPNGVDLLYSAFTLSSYNFYIPKASIHELFGNVGRENESYFELGEYLAQSVYFNISIDYLNDGLMESHFEKSFTLTSTDNLFYLNDLIAELNTNNFYTFDYNGIPFVLISQLTIEVEQSYYQGSSDASWRLDLKMYDYSDFGSYADYQDAQRVLASRSIDLYTQDFSIFKSISSSVNDLLRIEIFPNFSFLTLLALAITIPLTVWLLKAWLGG